MKKLRQGRCIRSWIAAILLALAQVTNSQTETRIRAPLGGVVVLPCVARQRSSRVKAHVIEWFRSSENMPFFIKIGKRPEEADSNFLDRVTALASSLSDNYLTASITIRNLSMIDTGSYRCVQSILVTSSQEFRVRESTVQLTVTAPPTFTKYLPPRYDGRMGNPLLLKCQARGVPAPVITWWKDGSRIYGNQKGVTVDGGTLRIASLSRTHAGKYTCRAGSVEGSIQRTTRVYVSAPPRITKFPEDSTVRESNNVLFTCEAVGYPSNITYRWFHNGVLVTRGSKRRRIPQPGTLIIYQVDLEDDGQVTCEASNGYGSSPRVSASLIVQYAARVQDMPRRVFGGISLPLTLYCPAVGVPPVSKVTWKKQGRNVDIQGDPRLSTDGNGSLVFNSVQPRDHGTYTCTPYNQIGTHGESPGTQLVIRDPPRFTLTPDPRYDARVGEHLTIPCGGDGDPRPTVTWIKAQGKADDLTYCIEGGNLSIASVRKEHHGMWQCVISNAVGDVKRDVRIIVRYTSPHLVQNLTAELVDNWSVRVTWDPGFDGGYPQHFLLWYKEADKGDNMWRSVYNRGDQQVVLLRHLKPDTVYQFSVIAESKAGKGHFSPTVTLKTRALKKPVSTPQPTLPPPSKLDFSTDSNGKVVLAWRPPHNSLKLLGYLLEFRRIGPDDVTEENTSQSRPVPTYAENINAQKFRTKRNVDESDWKTLDTTPSNVTSYVIASDLIYRDQVYEFQVVAVTPTQYTRPSQPIRLSTKGLSAYPCLTEPVASSAVLQHPVTIGVVVGSLVMLLIVALVVLWRCRHRLATHRRTSKDKRETSVEIFTSSDERECCDVNNQINPSEHIIVNDGFSSLSCLGRQHDASVTSPVVVESESKEDEISEGYTDSKALFTIASPHFRFLKGEDYCLLRPYDGRREEIERRRRSADEESVRRRRETAAKILQAQQARRSKIVAASKQGTFETVSCDPGKFTQAQSFQSHERNIFKQGGDNSVTARFLILDDRRRKVEPDCAVDESCFGVITSAKSPDVTQAAFVSTGSSSNTADDDVIVGCHVTGHVDEPTAQHLPLLSSSPVKVQANRPSVTSTMVRAASVSPDRFLRRPRSRASCSFDFYRERHKQVAGEGNNRTFSMGEGIPQDSPTLEIDCSNSDIEVRFITAPGGIPQQQQRTTQRGDNYKVGPDRVDYNVGRSLTPRVADMEVRMRGTTHHQRAAHDRHKRVSLEALLSPEHTNSQNVFASDSEVEKKIRRPSSRNRAQSVTSPMTRSQRNPQDAPSPMRGFTHERAKYTDYSKGERQKRRNSNIIYGEVPKPTMISIADISWDAVRKSDTIGSFGTTSSCVSPNHSPLKTTSPIMSLGAISSPPARKQQQNATGPAKWQQHWGSLGRTSRLQNLSLPVRSSAPPREQLGVQKKSLSFSFSQGTNDQIILKSKQGRRSLPASPTKALKNREEMIAQRIHAKPPAGNELRNIQAKLRNRPETSTPNVLDGSSGSGTEQILSGHSSSLPSSRVTSPTMRRHRSSHGESLSSGYVTQDTIQLSPGGGRAHSERSRRDNSSIEDNYEWDSEFAMESEILEALRKFESSKPTSTLSAELRDELLKFAGDANTRRSTNQRSPRSPSAARKITSPFGTPGSNDESDEQTRQDIERRCAVLRQEFLYFRQLQAQADQMQQIQEERSKERHNL